MSKSTIAMLGLFAVLFVFFAAYIGAYVHYHNYAADAENHIEALYENNQNIMSNYTLKVQELAGVSEMYKNDLKEVVTAAIKGRYGDEGSQAVFQWIQEQNPNLDANVYRDINTTIQAGRAKFENAQTRLIDTKKLYEQKMDRMVSGWFIEKAGFPKIDLDEYSIIVSQDTRTKFETKTDSAVKLR